MRDFYLCYPAILTNTLVPQLGLSSILQNQLGVALDALTDYNQRKTRIQWIRRYWAEQWFKYRFVTQGYAEKNAIKRPWGYILYRNLQPRSRDEAIEQGFYPCMYRGPQPIDAQSLSLLWCRDDNLFKRNF